MIKEPIANGIAPPEDVAPADFLAVDYPVLDSAVAEPPLEAQIFDEQITRLYTSIPVNLIGNPLCVVAFVAVLWPIAPAQLLLGWAVYAQLVNLGGMAIVRAFRGNRGKRPSKFWSDAFIAYTLADGVTWGMAGYLFFVPQSPAYGLFVGGTILGVAVGAQLAMLSFLPALASFTVLVLAPLGTRLLTIGEPIYVVLSGLMLLYWFLVISAGVRFNRDLKSTWLLRLQLAASEKSLRQSNDRLEKRVRERTAALRRQIAEHQHTEQALKQAKDNYRTIYQKAQEGIFQVTDQVILTANPALARICGYDSPEQMITEIRSIGRQLYADSDDGRALTEILGRDGFATDYETRLRRRDGRIIWVSMNVRAEHTADGSLDYYSGTLEDITKRKVAEAALREREAQYRAVVEAQTELICRCLPDGQLTFTNPAFRRMFGVDGESTPELRLFGEGNSPGLFPDEAARIIRTGLEGLSQAQPIWTSEVEVRRQDGELRWMMCTHTALFDDQARITEYQTVGTDITARKEAEQWVEFLATHDSLTGLPNRVLFQDHLELALGQADRLNVRVAVLLIDLDQFKYINDAHGHSFGDSLLQEVARRLRESVRGGDTVARLGGDEFAVIQSQVRSVDETGLLAGRILAALGRPFEIDTMAAHTGASIGITIYPDDSNDIGELLKHAELALYRAKSRGRAAIEFYQHDLGVEAERRMEVASQLRLALAEERFLLHYQPIIRLSDGAIVGAEALLRMGGGGDKPLLPSEFIPIAEAAGLIVPIGDWVLRQACRQMRLWRETGVVVGPVSINISAAQFHDQTLVEKISQALTSTSTDPASLQLEITEGALMDDAESAIRTLHRLVDLGLNLSIDDFGISFSSLNYLKRLPVRKIKIDRSFVRGITSSAEDNSIIRAIVDLAHSLDLIVLAEGVETDAQRWSLEGMGCDEIQGFLVSRPVPAADLESICRRRPRRAASA